MVMCRFFAQGACRHGTSCSYVHETSSTKGQNDELDALVPATTRLGLNLRDDRYRNKKPETTQHCRFFLIGKCSKGEACRFTHPLDVVIPPKIPLETVFGDDSSSSLDSRTTIPCAFTSRPGGCQNDSCPYLHATDAHGLEKNSFQNLEVDVEEDNEPEDDFIRYILGATIYFGEVGDVLKLSFPTDFSLASITGIAPGTTPTALAEVLRGFGVIVAAECIRISQSLGLTELKATVKVEDPDFGKELCSKLEHQTSTVKATSTPVNAGQLNSRKVYISWHKSTRSVWLNFGNGDIANRVAQKFNEGRYKCLGRTLRCSTAKRSPSRGGRRSNPSAWTIILSDVPSNAGSEDIENAIRNQSDKPRHIELGSVSYQASDAEISVVVRSHLEEHGLLENFYLAPTNKGKRIKATALFVNEADAKSACSLNNKSLAILGKGKMTVTIIQSAKLKVSTAVYMATKREIALRSKTWAERAVRLHVYPDTTQRFTTLKLEGNSTKDVAAARKDLDQILSGEILTAEDGIVWSLSLGRTGNAFKKVQLIAKELDVLIVRNKTLRHLQYYGSITKLKQAVKQVADMLAEDSLTSTNHDAQQQQQVQVTDINGNHTLEATSTQEVAVTVEGMCPICLDEEPDTPIRTRCNHTYCLECFENCCTTAASTSKGNFQIECQSDGGKCAEIFKLAEVKDHLSSSAFEFVLRSSFEKYVQQHPNDFHYCPTPDCGCVYRCTSTSNSLATTYSCPNCLEQICTSCHARHGEYTCAEYKDIESGGHKALEELKKKLNIKDCPKCKTAMEKTEGCNHMTCGGCRAHICWVCMAVFKTSQPCYDHMNKEHGGIGLGDLDRLVQW